MKFPFPEDHLEGELRLIGCSKQNVHACVYVMKNVKKGIPKGETTFGGKVQLKNQQNSD